MNGLTCIRKHAQPVPGCFSCKQLATSDRYRAALAKMQGKAPPSQKVGEPKTGRLPRPAASGPGTELKKMTVEMGVPACRTCSDYAQQMDRWGVEGCRGHLEEIVAHLESQAQRLGWFKWVTAGVKAVANGLPTTPRALALEAIRRAEQKETGHAG
jgi:hypothetical protein